VVAHLHKFRARKESNVFPMNGLSSFGSGWRRDGNSRRRWRRSLPRMLSSWLYGEKNRAIKGMTVCSPAIRFSCGFFLARVMGRGGRKTPQGRRSMGKAHVAPPAVPRPQLRAGTSQFMRMEREVESEFRPLMLEAIQSRVHALADSIKEKAPHCPCGRAMSFHDERSVFWISRFGRVRAQDRRYRCRPCTRESHPLLDELGVEPGRISGSLALRLLLLNDDWQLLDRMRMTSLAA